MDSSKANKYLVIDGKSQYDLFAKADIEVSLERDNEVSYEWFINGKKVNISDDKTEDIYSGKTIYVNYQKYEGGNKLSSLSVDCSNLWDATKNEPSSFKRSIACNVIEKYTNINGVSYENIKTVSCEIVVRNVVKTVSVMPIVANNLIDFDIRDMEQDPDVHGDKYVFKKDSDKNDSDKNEYTFNFITSPSNAEVKDLVAFDYDINNLEINVDNENQKVSVRVLAYAKNSTPSFTFKLGALDSINSGLKYETYKQIIVQVEDGKNIPFQIENERELSLINENPNLNYVLTNNIYLTPSFKPIKEFSGKLSGLHTLPDGSSFLYSINNLIITGDNNNNKYGLFRELENATIENLILNNISINIEVNENNLGSKGLFVGAIAGKATNSNIINCSVSDNKFSSISGSSILSLENSGINLTTTLSSLSGSIYVGGFIGSNSGSGQIKNPSSRISIDFYKAVKNNVALAYYVGGVAGSSYGVINSDLESTGLSANLNNYDVQVIINSSLMKNYLSTNIDEGRTNPGYIGGVVGSNSGTISALSVRPVIFGGNNIGGVSGLNSNLVSKITVQVFDFEDVYPFMNSGIVGLDNLGGLVGLNNSTKDLNFNSFYSYMDKSTYDDFSNPLELSIPVKYFGDIVSWNNSGSDFYAGGLIGKSESNVKVSNSFFKGEIVANKSDKAVVAGVLGYGILEDLSNSGIVLNTKLQEGVTPSGYASAINSYAILNGVGNADSVTDIYSPTEEKINKSTGFNQEDLELTRGYNGISYKITFNGSSYDVQKADGSGEPINLSIEDGNSIFGITLESFIEANANIKNKTFYKHYSNNGILKYPIPFGATKINKNGGVNLVIDVPPQALEIKDSSEVEKFEKITEEGGYNSQNINLSDTIIITN